MENVGDVLTQLSVDASQHSEVPLWHSVIEGESLKGTLAPARAENCGHPKFTRVHIGLTPLERQ